MNKFEKTLLKTVAHEFRTQLNTISNVINILSHSHEDIDEHFKKNLKLVGDCSEHLSGIVKNIIDITCENKLTDTTIEEVNVDKIIKQNIAAYAYNNSKTSIVYQNSKSIKQLLYGNYNRLSQVICSIFNNCISYTSNGTIEISTKVIKQTSQTAVVRFEIKDSDKGVDFEKRSRLYSNKFMDETDQNNCLNLNFMLLTKSLKLANGHFLKLPSQPEQNQLIFDVMLHKNNPVKKINHETDNGKKDTLNILIVDDNMLNKIFLKKILIKRGFTNFELACNGLEALDKIDKYNFNIIFMDIMMPVMDGCEATRKIKMRNPSIPVIAYTAINGVKSCEDFNKDGFDAILGKPINTNELDKILNSVLY